MVSWARPVRSIAIAGALLAGATAAAAAPVTDEQLAGLRSAYLTAVVAGEGADLHADLFATIFQRIQRSYVEDADAPALAAAMLKALQPLPPGAGEPGEVFRRAVNEALKTLDNYSRYNDAAGSGGESGGNAGFGGVGIELAPGDGTVRVVAPVPGSPAERAGVQAGDVIVRVDHQPIEGLPMAIAVARMRGEPGTPVTLTVRRAGVGRDFDVALRRDTIRRPLLRWHMEGEVLVLRLGTFGAHATAALEAAVAEAAAAQAPSGVVLDMRGNPGGLLREGIGVADAFLGRGGIASLRSRGVAGGRAWQADPRELLAGVPMVVLQDARSASAAELVADALQFNGRAVVMGQRSFGKGTVQTTYPLGAQGGSLKITTSLYVGPSGRSVQDAGVAPDIELRLPLPAAVEPAQAAAQQVEPARCAALAKIADAALACAVTYLRAGNAQRFTAALSDATP